MLLPVLLWSQAGLGLEASSSATLNALLEKAVADQRVSAIAALVVRADGEVLYQGSAGRRDPAAAEPIGPNDLYRLASMTKPFTTVAVMQLVEQGRLNLDDPISRHLPAFHDLRVVQPGGGTVPAAREPTIRDLLRHTSGISYNFLNIPGVIEEYRRLGVDDGLAAADRGLDDNMARLAQAPLAVQPGSGWRYGLSTDVLGAVVQKVTGQPLDAYLHEHVAVPLHLDSFAFHVPAGARPRMVAAVYPVQGQGLKAMASPQVVPYPLSGGSWTADPERAFSTTAYPSGGAGATATIGDYARFARMLLNNGELDGARILRAETVAMMRTPQTGGLPINLRGPGNDFGFGFAVVTDPAAANTRQPAGTYSWGGIYGTGFWVDPTSRFAIVVMTQTGVNGGVVAGEVREAVYTAMQ
ncbi:serine hydrolase domain-containing protein [Humitalea rosea]|uniref:serine hydrolase domain-containing protein n=1 Tax=Humitalea rosea TaxID=990373 RepID=UPI0013146ECF|nr:serine hydrolase domain-containing protein [Humitalea rosea]